MFAIILKTGNRKLKNFSHVGWVTSMVTFSLTTVFSAGLLLGCILSNDLCSVYGYVTDYHTVANMTTFWPEDIQPFLDSCMFGVEIATDSS